MENKSAGAAFKDLIATFRDMDRADFLAGVRASRGYVDDYDDWLDEAEEAIEFLKVMARHGDASAFNNLLFLGLKIARILEGFAVFASDDSPEKLKDPFATLLPNREEDLRTGGAATKDSLEILASLPQEKQSKMIKGLETAFPYLSTPFFPKCLLEISEKISPEIQVSFHDPENLPDPRFGSIESLTEKLAAIRAEVECIRMVRQKTAQADEWPMALFSVQELRTKQLDLYKMLGIGSELPFRPNPPKGRGKAIVLLGEGATAFAYQVYRELDQERSRRRSPGHLEDIRKSYTKYQKRRSGGGICNSSKNKPIKASKAQPWNELNAWKAEAALLAPLSENESVLDSWCSAGIKLIEAQPARISRLESLPESLRNMATDSNEQPSQKRIDTVIRNALKNGLKSIATRIADAGQGSEQIAD